MYDRRPNFTTKWLKNRCLFTFFFIRSYLSVAAYLHTVWIHERKETNGWRHGCLWILTRAILQEQPFPPTNTPGVSHTQALSSIANSACYWIRTGHNKIMSARAEPEDVKPKMNLTVIFGERCKSIAVNWRVSDVFFFSILCKSHQATGQGQHEFQESE